MFKKKNTTLALLVAALIIFSGGIFALAHSSVQSWVTSPGFVRGHNSTSNLEGWGYGYGYGYYGGWGYGYGYGSDHYSITNLQQAIYGFFGSDGALTILSVDADQTSFTVNYSSTYKTKEAVLVYATEADHNLHTYTDYVLEGAEAIGGPRSLTITGLTCDTLYYYQTAAIDLHGSVWTTPMTTVTTSSCSSGSGPATAPLVGLYNPQSSPNNSSNNNSNNNNQNNNKFKFLKNLMIGMNDSDVQKLQQFLNSHGSQVNASGAGSPGNETIHFGPATFKAVKKYQAMHASDMNLSPSQQNGTGYFGIKSRTYVNGIISNE